MRKIAIITTDYSYCGCDYGSSSTVVNSITDWAEVDDQTYHDLLQASYSKGFKIIEQPYDLPGFVKKTVEDYRKAIEAEKEAERKRKEAEDKKKLERKLKRQAKTDEAEKALLKELLGKHGTPE